jgi:hypothetical protein
VIVRTMIIFVLYFAVFFMMLLMMLLMTIVLMVILKAFLSFLNSVSAVVITISASPVLDDLESAESCIGAEMENHLYLC